MHERQVRDILALLDEGRWLAPRRVQLLAQLSSVYEAEGVLSSESAPALHRACADASACWKGIEERESRSAQTLWEGDEDGSIFWPWVGDRYQEGGVCLIGMNINHHGDWWSITDEYAIVAEQVKYLAQGNYQIKGSKFAYRSGATAMAVQASLDRLEPTEAPHPTEVPAALERFARLQLVKCSPLGERSKPTQEMCVRCPPRFLARELEILQPGVIIAFGVDARQTLGSLGDIVWNAPVEGYWRGSLRTGRSDPVDVFAVPHPQAHGKAWPKGQAALVVDVRARPVGPTR